MAVMLRRVRSRSVAWRVVVSSSLAEGRGGGAIVGRGSGDSATGEKDVLCDIVMRVRSSRDRDMRGWGFLTGDGVALPMESMIWSAMASSASKTGGAKVRISGLGGDSGDRLGEGEAFCTVRVTVGSGLSTLDVPLVRIEVGGVRSRVSPFS